MVFPGVLRGLPGPRLATNPTESTTSKPVVPGCCDTHSSRVRAEFLTGCVRAPVPICASPVQFAKLPGCASARDGYLVRGEAHEEVPAGSGGCRDAGDRGLGSCGTDPAGQRSERTV